MDKGLILNPEDIVSIVLRNTSLMQPKNRKYSGKAWDLIERITKY